MRVFLMLLTLVVRLVLPTLLVSLMSRLLPMWLMLVIPRLLVVLILQVLWVYLLLALLLARRPVLSWPVPRCCSALDWTCLVAGAPLLRCVFA